MQKHTWDIFVSHNRQQKAWVREAVRQWRELGLRVFFDEDSIEPGENIVLALDKALESTRHVVLVLSPTALKSGWVSLERAAASFADPSARRRRLIPVMLERVPSKKLPPSIKGIRCIDLTDPQTRRMNYQFLLRFLTKGQPDIAPPAWPEGKTTEKAPQPVMVPATLKVQTYNENLERRYNSVKVLGMQHPIPLRNIYVKVNLLVKISSREHGSIEDLMRTLEQDRHGFSRKLATFEGIDLVRHECYSITDSLEKNLREQLEKICEVESASTRESRLIAARKKTAGLKHRGLNRMQAPALDPTWEAKFAKALDLEDELARRQRLARLGERLNPLLHQSTAGADLFWTELKKLLHFEPRIVIDREVLPSCRTHPRRYIVLGKPGAGKTTFLKYLALYIMDGKAEQPRLPVLVSLKDLSDTAVEQDALSWLEGFLLKEVQSLGLDIGAADFFKLLDNGNAALLLDGLDEVSSVAQETVLTAITALAAKYPACPFLLSCRIAAYNYWFADFSDIEISDFDDAQVAAFVANWFGREPKVGKECLEKINSQRQTRELATTPLLLTLLCIAYDRTLGFPSNRAELYREAVDALLKSWDSSRRIRRDEIYKGLSLKRKETLLSRVAAETFEKEQFFIRQTHLEKIISNFIINVPNMTDEQAELNSVTILKAIEIQHGFFVERARGIYSFSHLTLHEYFAARYIVDNYAKGTLRALINRALTEPRWREVFLLTVELLDNADEFFDLVLERIGSLQNAEPLRAVFGRFYMLLDENGVADDLVSRMKALLYVAARTARLSELRHVEDESIWRDLTEALTLLDRTTTAGLALTHHVLDFGEKLGFATAIDETMNPASYPALRARLADLCRALLMMLLALRSDCYLSREVRAKIMSWLLVPR